MNRMLYHGCVVLFFSLLLCLSPAVFAAEKSPSSTDQSRTKAEKYLSKSLDTPLNTGQQESSPEVNSSLDSSDSGSSMTWFFIKVVLGLAVILGGIWLISKVIEQSGMAGTGSDIMGVRSTLALGQNQYLQIVQVGPQYFMLGVTENNVTKLDEITDSDTIDALRLDNEGSSEIDGPRGFSDIISNLVGTTNHDFSGQKTSDYLDDLTSRVSQLNDEAESGS